jgi:hypothetical protein
MPAIDIARLRIQSAVLVEKFDQPAAFIKGLHEILDLYADRTLRQGVVASPITVLPAYRVPQAVLRQIEMELGPLAAMFPEQAMSLTDNLWKDGYLESQLLAATLLGRIHHNTPLLMERITAWISCTRDEQVRHALLRTSLARIRKDAPARFLQIMQIWLNPSTPKLWTNAIQAIIPLVEDPSYQNLPPVFNLLSPALKSMPSIMQNELADLINTLYKSSPIETTYFLRQSIIGSSTPQLGLMLRRILPQLPAELRPAIVEMVREKSGKG